MEKESDNMNKIVLIGAGSANFGLGTIADIFKSKILEGSTLSLHDINPNTLERTKNIALKYKEKLGLNFKIEATTDRKEALKDATYCIISIEIIQKSAFSRAFTLSVVASILKFLESLDLYSSAVSIVFFKAD